MRRSHALRCRPTTTSGAGLQSVGLSSIRIGSSEATPPAIGVSGPSTTREFPCPRMTYEHKQHGSAALSERRGRPISGGRSWKLSGFLGICNPARERYSDSMLEPPPYRKTGPAVPGTVAVRLVPSMDGHQYRSMCSMTSSTPRVWLT